MDPQQRVLMELAWEAMESAGVAPERLRGSDCGVYVGIASTDYAYRIADDMDSVDAPMPTGNTPSIAANRLSYFYGLHGPSMALDTACSSSMVAFPPGVPGDCVRGVRAGAGRGHQPAFASLRVYRLFQDQHALAARALPGV